MIILTAEIIYIQSVALTPTFKGSSFYLDVIYFIRMYHVLSPRITIKINDHALCMYNFFKNFIQRIYLIKFACRYFQICSET